MSEVYLHKSVRKRDGDINTNNSYKEFTGWIVYSLECLVHHTGISKPM